MKKFLIASVAASLLATPLIASGADAASYQHRHTTVVRRDSPGHTTVIRRTTIVNRPVYRHPTYRAWARGQRFDYRQAHNYRVVSDWRNYRARRLYAPPRGYHWVRSGNDAVLVAISGGIIGTVLAGAFN